MRAAAALPDIHSFQQQGVAMGLRRLAPQRLLVLPALCALFAAFSFQDDASWRQVVLVATFVVVTAGVAIEVRHLKAAHPLAMHSLFWTSFLMQAGLIFGTGGLASPVLPGMVILSFGNALLLDPRRRWRIPAAQLSLLAVLGIGQHSGLFPDLRPSFFGGGGAPVPAAALWTAAGLLVIFILATARMGTAVRDGYYAIMQRAVASREEVLREHLAHGREMEMLTAEVAHEVKNPLATVKGLAAMIARDPADAKNGERLAVLRREVDRMQAILEEFVQFSRPIVPLSVERCSARDLCEDVVLLHEGLAREAGVALTVTGAEATLACDRRKVKQVLINLLQNAIQASPPGTTVQVRFEPDPAGGVRISVVDQGRGLDPRIREHLFRPGATTKPAGAGLGLCVARGIARQHGGDLRVRDGDEVGCIAELALPAREAA